jgi:hypothetical protein
MNRDIFVLSDDDLAFVNGGSGYGNPKPNPQAGLPSSVLRQGAKWFAKGAGWEVGRHTAKAVWHTASGALKSHEPTVIYHTVNGPYMPSHPQMSRREATKCLR